MKELLVISVIFILCVGLVAYKKSFSLDKISERDPLIKEKGAQSTTTVEIPNYEELRKITEGDPQQMEQFVKKKGAHSVTAVALLNYVATDYFGSAEKIKLLLDHGVNVNAKDYWGNTVLHNMAKQLPSRNGEEIERRVEVLLKSGADVNAKDNFGRTPLHILASGFFRDEKEQVAKLFIKKGANVNARDKEGNTPLHYIFAFPSGHKPSFPYKTNLVKILLKAGADVNAKNDYGITPLFYPVREWGGGAVEMTEFLILQGADVNARNKWGQTPIMWTQGGLGEGSPREVLLANGARKEDIKDERVSLVGLFAPVASTRIEDTTVAIKSGDAAKVEEYLKKGIWGYSKARNFHTQPFDDRSSPNNKFSFYPADPSQGRSRIVPAMEGYSDVSALAVAAEYNQVEIAKLLIDYGEDINDGTLEFSPGIPSGGIASDIYYTSPLTTAVLKGNKEMVKFLISNGVLLNTEDQFGKTALDYAKNREIKNMLIKAGARKGSGKMRMRD